ncbi:MAG: hypothetical protein RO009_12775 [Pseudorhodoplanes sp.]|jgi:hypothetical protein|nr:hypothetical protein [Pseudorhodoplanes sp.]
MPDQNEPDTRKTLPRSLICAGCGETFTCSLGGGCWCDAEPVRLPLPAAGDCLCRNCLRARAAT